MPLTDSQHVWQLDGHTVTVDYKATDGWRFTANCPRGNDTEMDDRPWDQVPGCRRAPGGGREVTARCEVHSATLEWRELELWDEQGTDGFTVRTAPIQVAWRRDADGVWLCPLDPEPEPDTGGASGVPAAAEERV